MGRWRNFLEHGFVPSVFYDIGANDPYAAEGQQVVYRPLMPETRFYLIEAMAKHEAALRRSGEPFAIAVLGERDGEVKEFYETRAFEAGNGDSLYLERTDYYASDVLVTSRQTTQRLDSLVEKHDWPLPDFMKLDTQGSELDILRGAPKCLASASGLQVECNVRQYNQGAPMLPEVIGFASNAGFRLYDVVQCHFDEKSRVSQMDLLFVRDAYFGSE